MTASHRQHLHFRERRKSQNLEKIEKKHLDVSHVGFRSQVKLVGIRIVKDYWRTMFTSSGCCQLRIGVLVIPF
jgi:ppGpp synthetase/RelA/SpoT-type nucleotidyltranferase